MDRHGPIFKSNHDSVTIQFSVDDQAQVVNLPGNPFNNLIGTIDLIIFRITDVFEYRLRFDINRYPQLTGQQTWARFRPENLKAPGSRLFIFEDDFNLPHTSTGNAHQGIFEDDFNFPHVRDYKASPDNTIMTDTDKILERVAQLQSVQPVLDAQVNEALEANNEAMKKHQTNTTQYHVNSAPDVSSNDSPQSSNPYLMLPAA